MPSPHAIPQYFDHAALRLKKARLQIPGTDANFLFDWALGNIEERLGLIKRRFPAALQLSPKGSPSAIDKIKSTAGIETLIIPDEDENLESLSIKKESINLVLSVFDLHKINDLPGTLIQIRRILKPDGLFIAALPGENTLQELRASMMEAEQQLKGGVRPRVLPFADKQQMAGLMQRTHFSLPVIDSERLIVTYNDVFSLMRDLRGMGETNILKDRNRTFDARALFSETNRLYQKNYADPDGRLRATFDLIFLTGWAPHESQQKPSPRGSATHSLTDIL